MIPLLVYFYIIIWY